MTNQIVYGGKIYGGNVDSVNSMTGVVSLDASDVGAIPTSAKGAANGVATLDGNGLVPSTQLPSYVDDVLEFASRANFPASGESGKIYVALDTNAPWRWTGSTYVAMADGNGTPSNALTADKLSTPRSLKTKLDSTTAVTFDGSAAQDAIPVTGILPIANGGTGNATGLATSATKLATARKLKTNLASATDATFDGTADQVGIPVTGILPIANGGTGAATVAGDGTKGKVLISGASATAAAPSFRVLDPADIPTLNQATTGNAGTATKLATARKLKTNLASTADATFDGSADQASIPVTGTLPVANGGTGATSASAALTALGGVAGTGVTAIAAVASLPASPSATTLYLVG